MTRYISCTTNSESLDREQQGEQAVAEAAIVFYLMSFYY